MKQQFTIREEANALTYCAFRHGFIEELHHGKNSELLENPDLSRITDDEMKKLMIEASAKLAELLEKKQKQPNRYWEIINHFDRDYCRNWDKGNTDAGHEPPMIGRKSIPEPHIDLCPPNDPSEWTAVQKRTILYNPLNAGVGPYRVMCDENHWVHGAAQLIDKEGAEQFLVNLLAVLRTVLK